MPYMIVVYLIACAFREVPSINVIRAERETIEFAVGNYRKRKKTSCHALGLELNPDQNIGRVSNERRLCHDLSTQISQCMNQFT